MPKIVINTCYGGFGLSEEAMIAFMKKKGMKPIVKRKSPILSPAFYDGVVDNEHYVSDWGIDRDDPDLVAVVEELGPNANGPNADLEIVEVPDDVNWQIEEYDGDEWVAEVHRIWR